MLWTPKSIRRGGIAIIVERLLLRCSQNILIFFLLFPSLWQFSCLADIKSGLRFSLNKFKFSWFFFILFDALEKAQSPFNRFIGLIGNVRIKFPIGIRSRVDVFIKRFSNSEVERRIEKFSNFLLFASCLYRKRNIMRFYIYWVILLIVIEDRGRLDRLIILVKFCDLLTVFTAY